ncbi:MAG: N-6 DNA methylase [Phascolarctobacterium sp.]|nr:N-6 DNA methylase [Phascolarctobacterium sp.]
MDNRSLKALEAQLWDAADNLRANSKLTSAEYCMPVLGLLFLRYAYGRFMMVHDQILKENPSRPGRPFIVKESHFKAKSAIFLPEMAQYKYLLGLKANVASMGLLDINGQPINSLGEALNNAMSLIENQSEQLKGILPKNYNSLPDDLLFSLLENFNNDALNDVGGDVLGRIYEYFLGKFAKSVASDDGVFFTPKSLVRMIVNIIEPQKGVLLDPACGSGGMFVQTGDFVNSAGMAANTQMTFYGQEKAEFNAKLCAMNIAVHGLNGKIKSGNEANTFYNDAHNLVGQCDYVMANPPFNVDKVNSETASNAGRLPFGLPSVNKKTKMVGNANYLWIQYFYAYLKETGRAGFVMASSATDSQSKDKDIRQQLVETGDVDVMISVGNNFFYTLSLPCSLWFFNRGKAEAVRDKVLFIDARNYYTVVDRTLNEWTDWQLKNLNAIVWLYRGEVDKYQNLVAEYRKALREYGEASQNKDFVAALNDGNDFAKVIIDLQAFIEKVRAQAKEAVEQAAKKEKKYIRAQYDEDIAFFEEVLTVAKEADWLYSKFADGEYQDVLGLCKIATKAEIAEKNYSLTPGAYVGVAPVQDDGVNFAERMQEIHKELLALQAESNVLMETISKNFKEMGL